MTKEKILLKYRSKEVTHIYVTAIPNEIDKHQLRLSKTKDFLIPTWEFPINIYRFEDYGKTWAFTEEELRKENV